MPAYRLEYDPSGEPVLTEEENGRGTVSDTASPASADDEIQWLLYAAAIEIAAAA